MYRVWALAPLSTQTEVDIPSLVHLCLQTHLWCQSLYNGHTVFPGFHSDLFPSHSCGERSPSIASPASVKSPA